MRNRSLKYVYGVNLPMTEEVEEMDVEELREEVEKLRTEMDFLINRMNVGTLIDYEE